MTNEYVNAYNEGSIMNHLIRGDRWKTVQEFGCSSATFGSEGSINTLRLQVYIYSNTTTTALTWFSNFTVYTGRLGSV